MAGGGVQRRPPAGSKGPGGQFRVILRAHNLYTVITKPLPSSACLRLSRSGKIMPRRCVMRLDSYYGLKPL